MTPKQKANIVSWVCLSITWCLLIAMFVFLTHWQLDRILPIGSALVLVMRFDSWYDRRQKSFDQNKEPEEKKPTEVTWDYDHDASIWPPAPKV